MSKEKTYIAIILDRSGSMSSTREQTVAGYNQQVAEIKANAKNTDIFVSLVTFTGEVYEHLWNESAEALQESTYESYCPNGSTAMYDAIGYVIDKFQKTTTADDKTSYLVITISDGDENSSRYYNSAQIKSRIEECKAGNNWTFTYMGCSEASLVKVARDTGIQLNNMAVWDNSTTEQAARGMAGTRQQTRKYLNKRSKGISGQSVSENFYSSTDQNINYLSDDMDFDSDIMIACADAAAINKVTSSTLNAVNSKDVFTSGGKVNWADTVTPKNS